MTNRTDEKQAREWRSLRSKIISTLNGFGQPYDSGRGDYFLLDENWGWYVHQLEFQNLALFYPTCIKALQALLIDFPDWEITVRVDVPGTEKKWPGMGIIIASDEIIDELQRDYLPPEFRDLKYEGSRRVFDGD